MGRKSASASVCREGRVLVVDLTPPRWRLHFLLLVGGLVVWGFGLARAVGAVGSVEATGERLFLVLVGLLWVVAGVTFLAGLVWNVAGRERIEVDAEALSVTSCVSRWCRTRRYPLAAISKFRVERQFSLLREAYFWMFRLSAKQIVFDYDGAEVHVGDRLPETEARAVIATIEAHREG